MEDLSRCFTGVPPPSTTADPPNITNPNCRDIFDNFDRIINQLHSTCLSHYEDYNENTHQHHRHRHRSKYLSLYIGSLGPCAYIRYHLSKYISWSIAGGDKSKLLSDASIAIDNVLAVTSSGSRQRITLLEGERVGALALSAAVNQQRQQLVDSKGGHSTYLKHREYEQANGSMEKVEQAKAELLEIGTKYVITLPPEECEVLYGRAGYLHAIAFVRSETEDYDYGKDIVLTILQQILTEGVRVANESDTDLPLLWTWHGKAYLGAIHGLVGILYTLLLFHEEVSLIKGAMNKIKIATSKLDTVCFASGNIQSSLVSERTDRLVHLCHGSPGHVLYLVKACEVFDDEAYLIQAEEIATNVIKRRGLLKKGVGLCHGISGNAYCFLALYQARNSIAMGALASGIASKEQTASHIKSYEWLNWAHHFANFAVENLNTLGSIPDRPYSLYEGVGGLICLLDDLKHPNNNSVFPCFDSPF